MASGKLNIIGDTGCDLGASTAKNDSGVGMKKKCFQDDEARKVLAFYNQELNAGHRHIDVDITNDGKYIELRADKIHEKELESVFSRIEEKLALLSHHTINCEPGVKEKIVKKYSKNPHLLVIPSEDHDVVRVWSDDERALDEVKNASGRRSLDTLGTGSMKGSSQKASSRKGRFNSQKFGASGTYTEIEDSVVGSEYYKIYIGGWSPDIKLEFDTEEGLKVKVYKGSITKLRVDAIVNAANEHLANGAGVAEAISSAAGWKFDAECRNIIQNDGPIPVAENYVTGAGALPCTNVIHAVGPQWYKFHRKEDCLEKLKDTVVNVLQTAYNNNFTIVVMPPISSGIFGVPKEMCAAMYILGIAKFSKFHSDLRDHIHELHIIDIKDDMLKHIVESYRKWKQDPASIKPFRLLGKTSGSHGYRHQNNYEDHYDMPKQEPKQDENYSSWQHEQQHGTRQRQATAEQPWMCRSESRKGRTVYTLKEKLEVHVYQGDITQAKVDAIVSTENRKFDGSGGLSRAIRKAAGYGYDDKLKQEIAHKPLYHSQVYRSSPGNLKQFRCIIHVIIEQLSAYTPPTEWQLGYIETGIWNILEHGNFVPVKKKKKGFDKVTFWKDDDYTTLQTIAMPLPGAGAVETEPYIEKCCERVFRILMKFVNSIRRNRPLKLKEIHFIDNRDIIIQCMNKVFKKKCIKGRPLPPRPHQHEVAQRQGEGHYRHQTEKTLRKDAIEVWRMERSRYSSEVNANRYMEPVKTEPKPEPVNKTGNLIIIVDKAEDNGKLADEFDPLSRNEGATGGATDDIVDDCIICMDSLEDAVKLKKCGHMFCRECISQSFKQKPLCPVCNTVYGSLEGDQPTDGKAYIYKEEKSLPDYKRCGTIIIEYDFADGTQGDEHPEPGEPYKGLKRQCYLPDNKDGNKILRMLKQAFEQRLIFTIGQSRTSGEENVLTWNDIHHKTRRDGGPEKFGYPDPEYLERVEEELNAKGIEM